MSPVLIAFSVYLVLVLVAGLATYSLNKTQEDFLLAGRRLNVWVATFSERASGESAWLLLGFPAAAMGAGLVQAWDAIGCVAGIILAWFLIAEGLRRETERLDALTLPEYFARRFGTQATPIRFVATFTIVFFYAFYVAAQFKGSGDVLFATFGIDAQWGIVIGAVIIILYTMAGGFFAVAWTDLVQAIIMIGTLVILPIVGMYELSSRDIALSETLQGNFGSWTGGLTGGAAAAAVASGLSWGLGYAGQPHTVTRFMSISRPEDIRVGRMIAAAWAIPAFTGAVFIGLIGAALYDKAQFAGSEETLMPFMAQALLPGWIAGIFISGAVAAMMSTADSQLLVGTSAVAEDFYHRGLGRKLSQAQLVTVSRVVTIGLGLAGFLLALYSEKLIFTLVSYAWAGLGATFGPALVLTLHWKRTSGTGVLTGMVVGSLSTVLYTNLLPEWDKVVTVRLVSFVLATVTVIVVSLLAPDDRKATYRA